MKKIPTTDTDLTVEYLNSVLTGFQTITSVTVKHPSTYGTTSTVRKIFLTYDIKKKNGGLSPSSIVAKFGKPANEVIFNQSPEEDFLRNGEIYKKEVMINKFLNGRNIVPTVYYAICNDNQDFVMLMEDCSHEDDVKGKDQSIMNIVGVDEARLIIPKLARFHAEFYHRNSGSHISKGILGGNTDLFMKEKGLDWIPECFTVFYYVTFRSESSKVKELDEFTTTSDVTIRKFAKRVDVMWHKAFDIMSGKLEKLSEIYPGYNIPDKMIAINEGKRSVEENVYDSMKLFTEEAALTLLHGDFRSDNILVYEKQIKFIDWQFARIGCGCFDLSAFISNSFDLKDLVDHEEELLELYVSVLQNNGCDWLSLSDIRRWYSHSMWISFKRALDFVVYVQQLSTGEAHHNVLKFKALEEKMVQKLAVCVYRLYKNFYA